MGLIDPQNHDLTLIGVVAIGRNEGERLEKCLNSLLKHVDKIVYVDSGSTDNSLSLASSLNVHSIMLDLSIPFTAARARNAGFKQLLTLYPDLQYVQFIDGDCEIDDNWLYKAFDFLQTNQQCAVVCGRRRERYPELSIYNQLCDWEWDAEKGEIKACGGDTMMRVSALLAVNGFREDLIAGEEPELCFRLRANGHLIFRLAEEMTLHDAAMTHFGQWWKRSIRSGYAYAHGCFLHGNTPEKYNVKESYRIWLWGFIIPAAILISTLVIDSSMLLLALVYPLQVVRLAITRKPLNRLSWQYAFFMTIYKFPELIGQIKFLYVLLLRKQYKLIEYK